MPSITKHSRLLAVHEKDRPSSTHAAPTSTSTSLTVTGSRGVPGGNTSSSRSKASTAVYENPFVLPADDQIFFVREKERQAAKERRRRRLELSVWEKARESGGKPVFRRRSKETGVTSEVEGGIETSLSKREAGFLAAASSAISTERRREKENMAEFIAKKREMFLVQMSLDTKREEIRKLEEKAQLKEEALKKSELMLEEDAIRFDTFLKENDKKAHEAIKRAEAETKAKQEKAQEIKKLKQQIQAVQADMSKLKERLADCLKYKKFLDELTPPEWFEKRKRAKEERMDARKEAVLAEKMAAYEEEKQQAMKHFEAMRRREEGVGRAKGLKHKTMHLKLPPPPVLNEKDMEDLESKEAEEEDELFFKEPAELLEIFLQIEASNLFLIQNSQETEQALEELKQEFRSTKKKMGVKTCVLKENIDELQQQIQSEEHKAKLLNDRMVTTTQKDTNEDLLQQLNEKVKEVYSKCGFDCDASPNTLTMLTDLEAKLEECLNQIEQMPQEYVLREEKLREKERRERVRIERLAQQQKQYEERLRKSMERSMQAPKKKTGKPVMFRSAPPQKKIRKKDTSKEEEKMKEEKEFFSW